MTGLADRTLLRRFGTAAGALIPLVVSVLIVLSAVVGPVGAALDTPAAIDDGSGTTTLPAVTDPTTAPTAVAGVGEATASLADWPTLGADDWPTAGRDPGRSGYTPNSSGPTTTPDARWIHAFDGDTNDEPAVVADGFVFVAGQETLRAVDADTGEQVWNNTGLDVDTVSVADGVVLTTEIDYSGDEIRAYRTTDGAELWNVTDFQADSTVVLDGTLYASRGEYLYAFDVGTGSQQWSADVNEDLSIGLSAADGTLYAASRINDRDHAVLALNASDGSERWRFEMEGPVRMQPVVTDGSVFVGAGSALRDQTTGDYDPRFYRLNTTDGHVEWMFDLNTRAEGAAIAEGTVYVSAGNTVRALDAATGQQQWRHHLSGSLDYGLNYVRTYAHPPTVADGTVYAVNNRGHVVALDATTGTRLWQYLLDGVGTPLAVADDRVYALAIDTTGTNVDTTRVYALETAPFRFSGFTPSSTSVAPGEQFTADVTVENVDDEARSYNLSLVADTPFPGDERTLDWANGSLAAGTTTTVTFTTTLHSAAAWNLSVKRQLDSTPAAGPVTVDVVHGSPVDAWPMGGFAPNRSAANPNTDGPSQHFQEAWNLSNVDEDTTPVVADGTVYVIGHQNRYSGGEDVHTVAAYDAQSGAVQWEYNFTAENRVPAGSPAVVGGTVYVVTTPFLFYDGGGSIEHGSVYALDAATGTQTWKQSVSINVSTGDDHGPIVADGRVYLAGNIYERNDYYKNASVVALDAATGNSLWSYTNAEYRFQDSYITYAAGEGHVFVTAMEEIERGTYEDELHVFDAATGSLAWATNGLVVDTGETPVVSGGLVFVVNESKNAAGEPAEELVALDVATGAEQWRFTPTPIPNYYGGDDDGWRLRTPAVRDGSLYVRQTAYSDADVNRLHRIDVATGTVAWNTSTNHLSRIQVVDGVVYGAETTFDPGYTRIYDAETGDRLGHTGQGLSLSVADGTAYAYDDWTGRLRALVEGGVIEYTDLSVGSQTVGVGENVTVTATVTNVGTLTRGYDVNLDVAPDQDHYVYNYVARDGTLAPGESTTVAWTVRLQQRGDFVFTLQPNEGEDSLERFMYDRAGSATVNAGDTGDGQRLDLGGPRDLAPDASSWPTEHFDAANTGGSSTAAPTAVGSDVVTWAVNHSYEWTSGPTVAAGTVFVGGNDDTGADAVFAYDAADGSLQWQYLTADNVEVSPVYASGYLYAITAYGTVYQLDASTGDRLWTFDAGDDGGITVVDDVVYVTGEGPSEDRLYALNATTRERLWTFAKPGSGYGMAAPAVVDGTVYVTSDDGHTYAVDTATGTEQWNRTIAGAGSRLHSPVVNNGVVYVDDASYGSTDANVYALDAADGSTIWSAPANVDGYTRSSPALANGTLYLTADGAVRAIDAATGGERWNTTVCTAAEHSPVYAGGVVYVPLSDSTLRAYDADTGALVWRYGAYGEASFTPAVVDGVLYTTGLENSDYTYSLAALTGGPTDQPPVLFDYSGLTLSSQNASTGESVTIEATVRNLGDAACAYTTDLLVNGSVVETTSGSVGTGYNDEATVSFTHAFATTGTYNVTIADLPPVQVNVSEPSADPVVSPTTLDFGNVNVGNTADRYVQVTNEGSETLYLDSASIVGANASDYSILSGPQTNVYPGDSATIWLRFAPTTSGTKTATLEVQTYFSGTVTATLTGVAAGPAEVDVTPTSYDFGDVEVGTSNQTTVTVSNVGGSALSFDGATITGADAAAYTVTTGGSPTTIPAGGSHDVTVEFAPEFTGTAEATLELATNDADESTVSVALTGTGFVPVPNRPPTVAADHYTVYVGEWLNVSAPGVLANDADPDGDAFDTTSYFGPDNGTLASFRVSGGFNYTADPGFTGTDTFTYWAEDAEGTTSSYAMVTIEVLSDPNRAPTVVDDVYSVHAGEWLNVSAPGVLANDADPDGDSVTTKYVGTPAHGDLDSFRVSGGFEYKPDADFTGTDSFTYWIEDEHGTEASGGTVTIEVLPPKNRAPTAVDDYYTVPEGGWLNVSAPGVLANDYDLDSDSISTKYVGTPTHGDLHRFYGSGGFNYSADATGTDTFVYWIEDDHGETAYASVTVEVVAENRPPTGLDDHYTVLEGEWLNVSAPGVLTNDYDLDGDSISTKYVGTPENGSLNRFYASGGFEYHPNSNFTGTDSFSYWIEDEHGAETPGGTVTIEVLDPNSTNPVAVDDVYSVYDGEWLNVSAPGVLANDADPDGDAISTKYVGTPNNGSLAGFYDTGAFNYRADDGAVGTDTFGYTMEDADGNTDTATVSIEVLPNPNTTGNRAPTAAADTFTVVEGEWLNVSAPGVLANDYDPDGDAISTKYVGTPNNGSLASFRVSGGFEYRADDGFTGTDSFSYWIEDDHGETAYTSVTIEVVPDPNASGNRAPAVVDDVYSVRAGEWLNVSAPGVLANDDDADGDSISTKYVGRPSDGTLHRFYGSGGFEYRPDTGFTGTDSFGYWIEDEHGAEASGGTVTIEVLPPTNRAPEPVSDDYVVIQGETLTVEAPGVLANDYDLDDDAISTKYVGTPTHGSLPWFYASGGFEYTPDAGFVGVDSFTYWIEDEHGAEASGGTVTITVVDATSSSLADVAVTPDSVDFGTVPAGTTTTATVTVANVGDQNLTVSGATVSGPNASAFHLVSGTDPAVLGYGGTHALTVEYAPTASGPATATLTVLSDDPDEPEVEVPLTGESYDAAAPTIDRIGVAGSDREGSTVYANETVDVAVDVTDAAGTVDSVRVTLDSRFATFEQTSTASYDATSGNWTASIPLAGVPDDGEYDVVVEATDDRGNRRTVTATDRVAVDRAAPQLSATVTRLNTTAATVTVDPDEAVRPGTVAVDIERPDGSVVSPDLTDEGDHWNGTVTLAGEGQYSLTATGTDRAGNRGTATATTLLATESTDANDTITVQFHPSDRFIRFTTTGPVNDTFVTVTESDTPLAPLDGEGVAFVDAEIGTELSANLSYAIIGIPVDRSLLADGTGVDDVTVRFFNETTGRWTDVPTTVRNVTVDGNTDEYWVATVTHFSTYGAVVIDATPPTVTATTPDDGQDLAAGTTATTLRVEYEDALSGVDPGRVGVRFDGSVVTTDAATTITSAYTEFEATGLADGATHSLAVSIADRAGNVHTETVSFTVGTGSGGSTPPSNDSEDDAASSDDGTDDTSTGSTGGSLEDPAGTLGSFDVVRLDDGEFVFRVRNATAGEWLSAPVENGALGSTGVYLTAVTVTPATSGDRDIQMSATATPTGGALPTTSGDALTALSFADAEGTAATLRLSVDRRVLADREVDPTDVVGYRLVDGSWTAVSLQRLATTDDAVVYEADVPSLTGFVLATAAADPTPTATAAEEPPATATPTAASSPDSPTPTTTPTGASPTPTASDGPGFGLGLALLALLGAAAVLGRRGQL
ncbi:PQQ-binding-like beta-propeller repeat protein [Halorarius litoreus]|uniref:outer membrane protein assembly factor BamB family protein n=1 Tax=Halorarius litoreus TaxID=2962676 RepID=UPI0020CE0692|nr:PQQ-binding-like beta-propeller repeat protein [Halorarius litoreus]